MIISILIIKKNIYSIKDIIEKIKYFCYKNKLFQFKDFLKFVLI